MPALLRALLTLTLVVVSFGVDTARARELAVPQGAPPAASARVPDRLPNINEYWGTPIEGTAFAAGGARGSLGLGLLLPAIGAGINAAHVQATNRERGARAAALTGADLDETLRAERANENATQVSAPEPAFELVPAVQLWFWSDETFSLGCTITATLAIGERRPWRARYQVSPDGDYDLTPESIERAEAAIQPCIAEANRLFEAHAGGALVTGEVRRVRSNEMTLRMRIVETEAPARIIAHDALGVIEFAPGRTQILDQVGLNR